MLATVCKEASHLDTMCNTELRRKERKPDCDENEEVGGDPGKTDPNKQEPGDMLDPKADA